MIIKRVQTEPGQPVARIHLIGGGVALVDQADFERLCKYAWRAVKSNKCTYAVRREIVNGQFVYTRMHRQIAKTPDGWHCHHWNHNSLDNRTKNLCNMLPATHRQYHGHMKSLK